MIIVMLPRRSASLAARVVQISAIITSNPRGVGSTGAWTLGTFAADLATFNGLQAYGILVVAQLAAT